ncbi:MAG: hypothetical protein K5841_10255, partial [Fretibacterium sp.]|nr:hypothetical protein [Fretibacterium sp.]
MKIVYKNKSVQRQFDSIYQGKWRYPKQVKDRLLAMENYIRQAASLNDIVRYPPFHFHPLRGGRKGEWSLYVGQTGYRV